LIELMPLQQQIFKLVGMSLKNCGL